MRKAFLAFLAISTGFAPLRAAPESSEAGKPKVYVLPVREEISPPLVYIVRRGVKEAMEAKADLLVIDMDTNGGRADSMMEIIEILDRFDGLKVTYVNEKAFSAGALIAFSTDEIYMAPGSYIGAAAPVMMTPGGGGAQGMPDTMEAKSASAISAMIRARAERYGHNKEVVDAMIRKTRELIIDGDVLNREGEVLTLNDTEAAKAYGDPPKPLVSAGTVANLDELLRDLDFADADRKRVEPTGAEDLASWINTLNWLWLIIGVAGIYIEIKTPGFGLPGIVGICAFVVYFLGGYVAALSGLEWAALFVLGLIMVILELFVFPGTVVLGLAGAMLMVLTMLMAMVDMYPGMPAMPTWPQLQVPFRDLGYAFLGSLVAVALLARFLPKTPLYATLVTQAVSGVQSIRAEQVEQSGRVGLEGEALCALRPSGKGRFGDEVLDVMTGGEMVEKGARIKIVDHSSHVAVVSAV